MLVLLAALTLATGPGDSTPATVFRLATQDLVFNVAPERRPFTRYLSLHAVPPERRLALVRAVDFALASTSFESRLVRFPVLGDLLIRLDLEELGWDRFNRADDIERLDKLGVKFVFKADRDRKFFEDIWETIAFADPYFRAPKAYSNRYDRGWVDPLDDEVARYYSQSAKFLVRADWLNARITLERQDGGFYSQLLLLPDTEAALYKRLGADLAFIDATAQARHGGAVIRSQSVAIHNRELQVIPGAFGDIWRTFDFAQAGVKAKDVQLTLAGTAVQDGREIIFRLPNGLSGYYLADGKGKQVNVVPQAIALDMRGEATHPIVDRNVTNAYKCVSCHGPESGIIPFKDQIAAAITARGVVQVTTSTDHRQVVVRNKQLREYYLSNLDPRIVAEQAGYAASVKAISGLDPGPNADGFVVAHDTYTWGLITPEVAAREMGYSLSEAVPLWEVAGDQQVGLLHGNIPIRREAWELVFAKAMLAKVYPWESVATPAVIVKKPGY